MNLNESFMQTLLAINHFLIDTVNTLATLIKVLLWSRPVKLPVKQHTEMLVLGNGPSLKTLLANHSGFLKDKDLMAVNHFADTDAYVNVKPAYYMINVPEFWTDQVDADVLQKKQRLIKNLVVKTDWPLHLVLGNGARKSKDWVNLPVQNPNISLHYINPTPIEGFKPFRYFCYKHNCGMPRPHNVLIPSLMTAINMAYKTIYVAGADHSWLKDLYVADDNTVYLTQKHFYDAQKAQPDVMKKMGRGQRRLHEILHKFMLSFKAYFDINDYGKSQGVKIYNITPNSFIDAFERKKIL